MIHSAQARRRPPDSAPQQTGTSRTVKRYPSSAGPITSNALPNGSAFASGHGNWPGGRGGNANGRSPSVPRTAAAAVPQRRLSNALSQAAHVTARLSRMQLVSRRSLLALLLTRVCACVCFPGANLTSGLDRIKIVFTPMLCRRVCGGGRCHNSCEKGDTTT
ncbi:hypothetical protein NHX12_019894, partial [Muraenolepis orangiensis]